MKYKRVHEEVLKRVDKYENDNQPQVCELTLFLIIFLLNFVNIYGLRSITLHNTKIRTTNFYVMHDLITKKLSKHFLNKSYEMLKFPNARPEGDMVQVKKSSH